VIVAMMSQVIRSVRCCQSNHLMLAYPASRIAGTAERGKKAERRIILRDARMFLVVACFKLLALLHAHWDTEKRGVVCGGEKREKAWTICLDVVAGKRMNE